jgi:hypothetical protein
LCVQTCERSIMELQQRVRAEYELTQDTSAQLEALKRIEQVWVGGFAFVFFLCVFLLSVTLTFCV